MTKFTPPQFFRACEEFAKLSEALPAPVLAGVGSFAVATMAAASRGSGGVTAGPGAFSFKKPRAGNGQASAAVVGHGFAVLDEYGSYKKPGGYDEYPKKSGKRQINAKRASYEARGRAASRAFGYSKSVLSNGGSFVAAYAHHPAQKAHPYVAKAEVTIGAEVEKAFDKAVVLTLNRAFH